MTAIPRMIFIAQIQRAVAARYHVSVSAMLGRKRHPRICRPRHVAMYLARRLTRHSYADIGYYFGGRDHSTVHHGCRMVEHRVFRNQKCRVSLATLIDGLAS